MSRNKFAPCERPESDVHFPPGTYQKLDTLVVMSGDAFDRIRNWSSCAKSRQLVGIAAKSRFHTPEQ